MITDLWETHSNKVCHYLVKRVGDRETACDLTQETYLKLLKNTKRLEQADNREAWLFTVARNTLIDYTRKKKEKSVGEPALPEREGEPEDIEKLVNRISQCLWELIDESYEGNEREVLMEVFTEALSQKEAARYLDIPYSTLKSRVQKARKKIRQEFIARCCSLDYNSRGDVIACTPVV